MTLKTYVAHFRYSIEGGIGPYDNFVEIIAPSLRQAKITARNLEGQDEMTWLMGVELQEGK